MLAALAVMGMLAACDNPERERGRKLFAGELPMPALLAGHTEQLPSYASRCVNCHAAKATATTPTATFGTALSAASLEQTKSRRGGPPSRFELSTFCRLLRTGVDTTFIVIPQSMPLYPVSDVDCEALWIYLTHE